MARLTVFTPTYNRADLLVRGYEALKRQTSKDFLWMIIDDGSTDNTPEIVKQWIKEEHGFEIRYIKKENGGLHTGYNTAIANADTELMVCVDSDDYMPDHAVEIILSFWDKEGSDQYAGIVGLDFDMKDHLIGDPLPDQKTVNLIDLLVGKYPIVNGDRTNVIRTELYKEVAPMKSFPGEKNFNPHYMHLQISQKYDFLVLNENLKYVEYQEGGMTNSMWKQYLNSPNSFAETRLLYLSFAQAGFPFKCRNMIHYISSCRIAHRKGAIRKIKEKGLFIVLYPIGICFSHLVKKKGSSR